MIYAIETAGHDRNILHGIIACDGVGTAVILSSIETDLCCHEVACTPGA